MNENEFVRKDVHDANMNESRVAVNDCNRRIDDLNNNINRQLTFWGYLLAFMGVFFTATQVGLALILYFLTKTPG